MIKVKQKERVILNYFLIFKKMKFIIIILSLLSFTVCENLNYQNNKNILSNNEYVESNQPLKALLLSSILPGAGQYYINEQENKGLFFLGIEFLSLFGLYHFKNKGDKFKNNYQNFGDQNWSFSSWCVNYYEWNNPENIFFDVFANDESLEYPEIWEDSHYIKFSYNDNGIVRTISTSTSSFQALYDDYNLNDLNSVESFILENNVQIVQDHNFYENISKYNHFFAGWNDINQISIYDNNGYIVATSPNKASYRSIYDSSVKNYNIKNTFLNIIFINHFVSMLDALIVGQINKNASLKMNMNADLDFYQLNLNIKLR